MPARATSPRGGRVLEHVLQGAPSPHPPSDPGVRGVSLPELVVVLGLLALTAAVALPSILGGLDDARAVAAARYVAALVRLTRVQAATRSTRVGLRFEPDGATYRYAVYVDGDGDGLRRGDIRRGIDTPITPTERIGDRFPGVELGVAGGSLAYPTVARCRGTPIQFGWVPRTRSPSARSVPRPAALSFFGVGRDGSTRCVCSEPRDALACWSFDTRPDRGRRGSPWGITGSAPDYSTVTDGAVLAAAVAAAPWSRRRAGEPVGRRGAGRDVDPAAPRSTDARAVDRRVRELDGVESGVPVLGGGDRCQAGSGVSGCAGLRQGTRPPSRLLSRASAAPRPLLAARGESPAASGGR